MKHPLVSTLVFIIALASFDSFSASHSGKVSKINMYGGEYSNSWRGSILYRIDNMPAGVNYFYVRQTDIAFQTFLSTLLSAKHAKATLTIHYDGEKVDANGYANTVVIVQE